MLILLMHFSIADDSRIFLLVGFYCFFVLLGFASFSYRYFRLIIIGCVFFLLLGLMGFLYFLDFVPSLFLISTVSLYNNILNINMNSNLMNKEKGNEKGNQTPTYDYVIIGGGLSGIYLAYQLCRKYSRLRNKPSILILEKEDDVGGRIHTIHTSSWGDIEAGAGRFSKVSNKLLCKLIKHLGLWSHVYSHDSHAVFMPSGYHGKHVMNSAFDYSLEKEVEGLQEMQGKKGRQGKKGLDGKPIDLLQQMSVPMHGIKYTGLLSLDSVLGDTLPNVGIVATLLASSKTYSKSYLQSVSLIDFARKVLSEEDVEFLLDSFGYYSELVIMNAYDSLKVINSLSPFEMFCGLRGGLSQIIDELVRRLRSFSSVQISRNSLVRGLYPPKVQALGGQPIRDTPLFLVNYTQGSGSGLIKKEIYARHCIFAVPTDALAKFPILRPLKNELASVTCAPLCRIYARYKVDLGSGSVWFNGLPKFTTDNDLRMVIPIDESRGIIMMSYTDNMFADRWKRIYDRDGKDAVEKKLCRLMEAATGRVVPRALELMVCYWKCGVGYWTVGAKSDVVSQKMIQPFAGEPLYICGENFSANGQQWMEGALETAESVLALL